MTGAAFFFLLIRRWQDHAQKVKKVVHGVDDHEEHEEEPHLEHLEFFILVVLGSHGSIISEGMALSILSPSVSNSFDQIIHGRFWSHLDMLSFASNVSCRLNEIKSHQSSK